MEKLLGYPPMPIEGDGIKLKSHPSKLSSSESSYSERNPIVLFKLEVFSSQF